MKNERVKSLKTKEIKKCVKTSTKDVAFSAYKWRFDPGPGVNMSQEQT